MQQEYWKPVPGYEGFYEVSDQGRVRSLDRVDCGGRFRPSIELKPSRRNKKRPYLSVVLNRSSRKKTVNVHTLVAEAFLGDRPALLEVLHGDRGPQCNEISNLRYGTRTENQADRLRDGTDCRGEKSPNAKLSRELISQMQQCREREGLSYMQLGKRFDVDQGTAHRALTGRSWKHL